MQNPCCRSGSSIRARLVALQTCMRSSLPFGSSVHYVSTARSSVHVLYQPSVTFAYVLLAVIAQAGLKGVVCGRVRVTTSLISLRRGQAAVRPHTRGGPPPDACRPGGASPAQGSLRSRTFPRRRWEVTVGQCLGDALDQNPYLDSSVPLAVVLAGIEHPAINSGLSPLAGPCGP